MSWSRLWYALATFKRVPGLTAPLVAVVVIALIYAGAHDLSSRPTTASPTATIAPTAQSGSAIAYITALVSPPTATASPIATLAPVPTSAPTVLPTSVLKDNITGLGAARPAWDAAHTADPTKDAGTAYNLTNGVDRYAAVLTMRTPRIVTYTMQFGKTGITLKAAKAIIPSELPADSTLTSDKSFGGCELLQFNSATLNTVTSAPAGNVIDVTLESDDFDVLDPQRITSINFLAFGEVGDNC